jgi:MtN3 and saliva related transmembrane protein
VTTVDILAIGAVVAGLAMAASPILQIRRMRRTRSSADVSLLYLSLLDAGFIVWLAYALALGNSAMIVSNTASFAVMAVTILTALRFRRAGARRDATGLATEAEAKATAADGQSARAKDATPG